MLDFAISGNIVDIINRKIVQGTVVVKGGKIASINTTDSLQTDQYILPGFIDAHIHIESSMLIPSQFARLAVVQGTVATVSDPHEIGNVLGIQGVRYMLQNGKKVPFNFYFGASPCVPATSFETSGAAINSDDIRKLFEEDGLHYLSEMMNYPGVLNNDPEVLKKINIAKELNRPVDGHAPGLRGEDAKKYIQSGISTDHECFTLDEALDKVKWGMKILIREGSAAKNFEALHSLIGSHPTMVMFCSDDKHPNELVDGHINLLVKRAVDLGYDVFDVLRCASLHPIEHYGMDVGLLRVGDLADFIVVDNLKDFKVLKTYIKGQLVAENGKTLIAAIKDDSINHFAPWYTTPQDFALTPEGKELRVIEALDGQLITNTLILPAKVENGNTVSDVARDILKLTVVNRYKKEKPAIAFIRNFSFQRGAIASCIAHDSHNIVAVGVNDEEISKAVNALMDSQGGISVVDGQHVDVLPLPIAGLMSSDDGYLVAKQYAAIDQKAKALGSQLQAPFMTLSFMALLVIPQLKLSDKGLFDGKAFCFVPVFKK